MLLVALGGPGNKQESLLDLLTDIVQNEDYKTMWEEAVRAKMDLFFLSYWMVSQPRPYYSPCST